MPKKFGDRCCRKWKQCGADFWARGLRNWQLLPFPLLAAHSWNPASTPREVYKQSSHRLTKRRTGAPGLAPRLVPSQQPATTFQPCEGTILKVDPPAPAELPHPKSYVEQRQALPAKPCLNCRFVNKINAWRCLSCYVL